MSPIDARHGTINYVQRDQINYNYGPPVSAIADELERRLRSVDADLSNTWCELAIVYLFSQPHPL
jgi:hypothetical protein